MDLEFYQKIKYYFFAMDLKQYPKFDGTNWESWRFIFRAWCCSIEAIHLVDAVSIEKGTVAESDEDNKLNVRIYVWLCSAVVGYCHELTICASQCCCDDRRHIQLCVQKHKVVED